MAKILLAEDDEFLREILTDYLQTKGHEVTAVPNGKLAEAALSVAKFELVISDVQMPFVNGVELLQAVKQRHSMPFILMTGFTNLLETQRAAQLGADGFLSKPFKNQDLVRLVESVLNPQPAAKNGDQGSTDEEYCKVSIDEFVARPKIEYDIYIRLPSGRYLKVAHLGDSLDINRLKSYREKGITHLHIRKEDFDKLVQFNLQVSNILQENDKVPAEKKIRFMRYTGEVIMERCYVDDMDREAFQDAQQFFKFSMNTFLENRQLFDVVNLLNEHSDHLYAHCLGVSIYSVMIAKKMNYEASQTCFKLAMAGMFHDIGKKEIERSVLDKPRPLLSVTERKSVESHVQRGREIMEAIPGVPADVIQIIYEHHEDENGQGYPCGTPRMRLHPLSRIVQVADIFVTRALKSPSNPGASAAVAISQMESLEAERINKVVFAALKQLSPGAKAA